MKNLIIVAAQINLLVGDIEGNTDLIIKSTLESEKKYQADLTVFPELSLTGYPPEDLLFRPVLYTRVHEALDKLCQSLKDSTLIVGYPDHIDGKYYNMAAVIHKGKIIKTHTKQQLPNYTVFDEKRYFCPGTEPTVFELKGVKIGLIICEDTWFDAPTEQVKNEGAQLLVSINASPFAQDKSHARHNLLAEKSKRFNLPIVYVNIIGGQDELVFDGGSMVYDHSGQLCQQAPYFEECLMKIEFDVDNQLSLLTTETKIPEQTNEQKIYQTLVLGVKDYIEKNRFPGAIIGLSGGVDSALTLAIACDAIGSDRVHAVMMPTRYTTEMSLEDAKKQAEKLNCKYSIINIENVFESFLNALKDEFKGCKTDSTEENLQARCRGTILMAISNKKGSIVLTTGNKSEMAVGYATLYGDMAGGFSVLKDVYKTMVYRLCSYRNSIDAIIPERVIERPPSAELADDQKDQDVLPPYPVLDEILYRFVAKDEDAYTISKYGFELNLIKKIVRMVTRNEYKRRQAPIGIRITERAFGKDRRYPITSGYFKKYDNI